MCNVRYIGSQRIDRLVRIYPTVDDIDYLVGGMLERIIPGTLTTPSFRCVLGEGFFRYKVGDRFYYEYDISPGAFSPGKHERVCRVRASVVENGPSPRTRAFSDEHLGGRAVFGTPRVVARRM